MERFLTICNYSLFLRYKYLDPEQLIRVKKSIRAVEEKEIDAYRKEYLKNKSELKDSKIREIYLDSCNLAAVQLNELNWMAVEYTPFFIAGGISFLEVERLGLTGPKPTPNLS